MPVIVLLITFPLIVAAVLLAVRNERARTTCVGVGAAAIAIVSVVLACMYLPAGRVEFAASSVAVDVLCGLVGLAAAGVVIWFALRYKNRAALVLAAVQALASVVFEAGFAHGKAPANGLYVDGLTILMALVIGIIGSAICIYALGYMKDFQAHQAEGAPDRRPLFFSLMFLFLSAMYLIVFSDNLAWMFCGWEVTTVCSFLLIGYTRTDEAIHNAFRQIIMNLLGGIAFVVALFCCAAQLGTLSLSAMIAQGVAAPSLVALPLCALGFAGMTKAAQMPFHTWLLGAMVAPTPTSALLHSSTMVKAGVFLLVKLAPLFALSPVPQAMVVLGGGITFVLCSFMAISQTNAKRILAYSTIANLGLICICAGVGTPEAVWAATLLILFHAVAKSLLFLCVGTAEHHIGSRDVEDMDLLFERMPRLARYMMLGIMVMFVAPFGMLLAKWAAIVSLVETGQYVVLVLVAFGSAATFMFWAKWMGKLAGIAGPVANIERTVHPSEWIAISLMVGLAVACSAIIPLISQVIVEPYLADVFGASVQTLADGNLWITAAAVIFSAVILFAEVGRTKARKADVYLAGVAVDDAIRSYRDATSATTEASARNMYLEGLFGPKYISPAGSIACATLMAVCLMVCFAPVFCLV